MKNANKTMLTVALAVSLVLVSASACLAYTGDTAECHLLVGGIMIDGDLSDWNTTSPVVLDSPNQLVRDANQWTDVEDLSARIYLMWSEAALYLAADVLDDTPFMYREGFPPDLADALVLHFGTDHNSDPNRGSYDQRTSG